MRRAWLIPAVLLVLTHVTGGLTLGAVTTDSMEDTMPSGTAFLAVRSEPSTGDIVVFTRPDGVQAVHRVVDVTEQGLVTQGDANERTDQATGLPHVDPDTVNVVPHVAGEPLALSLSWLKPLGILAIQILLLTYALRNILGPSSVTQLGWPLDAVRLHHLVATSGLVLLAASPLLAGHVDASGTLEVQGLLVPTFAYVEDPQGASTVFLWPLETSTVSAEGPTDTIRAPALPGAVGLSRFGAGFALIPTLLVLGALSILLRLGGH